MVKTSAVYAVDFKNIGPVVANNPSEAIAHADQGLSAGKIFDVPTKLKENIQTEYYKFAVAKRSYVFLDEAYGLQITWKQQANIYTDWGMSNWISPYHNIKKSDERYVHVYMLEPGTYYIKVSNEWAYKSDSIRFEECGGKSENGRGPLTLYAKTYLHTIPVDDFVSYKMTGFACDKIVSVKLKSGYTGMV